MSKLKDFFYGILIGIANIIPGASGGTIAVITGVYDKLIDSIANVLKNPLKSIKKIIFLVLGLVFGLLIALFGIEKLIEVAPIPTFFFFSGLIIGTIPFIFNKVKKKKKNKASWILFAVSFLLIIALAFLSTGAQRSLEFNLTSMIILFFLGVVSLVAMIIPGVSGSMIVASFGYYDSLISLATTTLDELLHFNFTSNIFLLLSFILGAGVGIISFAKLVKFLFKKYFTSTFIVVLGLVSASSVTIIILALTSKEYSYNYFDILLGIGTLIIGGIFGYFLTKLEKNEVTND